jgi:PAS domain-containing protein
VGAGPARGDQRWQVAGLLLILVLLALGAWRLQHTLIPSMGLLVVGAALFLKPRAVAALGLVAFLMALAVALLEGWSEAMGLRMANVTLAVLFAIAASVFLDRRTRRIEELGQMQAAILASIPDAVMLLDDRGRLVRGNAGLTRLVPAATVGEPLHPLLGHVLADGTPCPGECALDGRMGRGPGEVAVDGQAITVDGRLVPVDYTQGRVSEQGLVVVLRDVAARVVAEEDRRVLLAEAARNSEQLEVLRTLGSPTQAELPRVDGVTTDVYSTGGEGNHRGSGELVDISLLPDGRALLLMVDASGEGVASLRDAWKVLFACRAHMAAGAPLGEMLARAATTLDSESAGPVATVAAVVLDGDTGHVQAAMGGHPPALLVRASGTTEWLDAAGHGLGDERPGSQSVVSTTMGPADSLVLFSDGVIDRSEDVIQSLAMLRSSAVALRAQPILGLARRTLESVQPGSADAVQATLLVARIDQAA